MKWLRDGTGWVWLTAGMLGIALFSVFSVLLIVGWHSLSAWQPPFGVGPSRQNTPSHSLPQEHWDLWQLALTDCFLAGGTDSNERLLARSLGGWLKDHPVLALAVPHPYANLV